MFELSKLTKSTEDFKKYVEPQLYDSGLFNPDTSYLVTCEGANDDLRTKMDMYAGIDMCTVDMQNQCVQGIASRIQRGRCYNTFTVRAITDNGSLETEFRKRSLAITNGNMYPTWTVQAYVYDDLDDPDKEICTAGIIRTTDLFDYIINQLKGKGLHTWQDFIDMLHNNYSIGEIDVRCIPGGAIFLSCDWNTIQHHGINVDVLNGVFDKQGG